MKKFFYKLFSKRKRGFTLVEVLVVIIILGILSAIAVPIYSKIIRKSRVADGLHGLDMLAGAQEKYFIANGNYSPTLLALNSPFKEYRVQEGDPFSNIYTTNFTYEQMAQTYCLLAISNNSQKGYTLVKNYRTKEHVGCWGDGCSEVEDFVGVIDDLSGSCPQSGCLLSDKWCEENGGDNIYYWASDCSCHHCSFGSEETCREQNGTWNEDNCSCEIAPQNECSPEGSIHSTYYEQGSSCDYNGSCGIYLVKLTCKNGTWQENRECRPKGEFCELQNLVLDPVTCECGEPNQGCDEELKPDCCNFKCDPCPNEPSVSTILAQGGTPTCWHCGIGKYCGEAYCDAGRWKCPDRACEAKELTSPLSSSCGNGRCGIKHLIDTVCEGNDFSNYSGLEIFVSPVYGECTLSPGNDCFNGAEEDCDNDPYHNKVCHNCHWDTSACNS